MQVFSTQNRGRALFIAFLFLHTVAANTVPHLFKKYPLLKKKIGHVTLGAFPTRIQKLDALGKALGCNNLYMKMDNESGTLFGGNKVRKLEFLLGCAVHRKAQGVVTWGFAGSNHTCATAVYAQQLNLRCICMHLPQQPTYYAQRNLLLSHYYGAELNLYRGLAEREFAMYEKNRAFKEVTDNLLYFIPSGGSNEIGTLGFINAALELKEQIDQGLMPEPDLIYIPLGSCGTTAGLLLGAKIAGLKSTLIPVCIEHDEHHDEHVKKVITLYNATSSLLHKYSRLFPELSLSPNELDINYNFIGPGYAIITPEAHAAIKLLHETEGIKLDGTYAGKTLAAMVHDFATQKITNKVVLFWNTFCSGSFDDIIQNTDYKKLPKEYHRYFELPKQANDQGI